MLHTEFIASLSKLNLSQAKFAKLVGVRPVTVWRWKEGDRLVPSSISLVVRLLMDLPQEKLDEYIQKGVPDLVLSPEEVLGITDPALARAQRIKMAKSYHPDGGRAKKRRNEDMQRVNWAVEQICG